MQPLLICLLGGDGLTSSRQLMEMSQLLRLYQARGWGALPAEDLLLYLKRLEQSGYQPGREGRKDWWVESGLWAGKWVRQGREGCVCCPLSTLVLFWGRK